MRNVSFFLKYIILLTAQVLLWNYFNFSQFIILAFLPTMILFLPGSRKTIFAMVIAFITGFAVDFCASGMLGLTSLALVPTAFVRREIIHLVFGLEVLNREEDLSVNRHGLPKIILAIILSTAIFLLIFIWADGAGTRPFWFNAVKFAASLSASCVVSIMILGLIGTDNRERWK